MNPERMEEIEDRLDGGDEEAMCNYQMDVADLLRELGAYQHLILSLLDNFKGWEERTSEQRKCLLERTEGTLTAVAGAHDFGDNNVV